MNRKTLTALAAFIVLAIVAAVALRQPEKGESAADHPRPIPRLDPVAITTLEVTRSGVTTILKNDGGQYKLISPMTYPADDSIAKAAFDGLGKMDVTDLVTENKAKQAEFQVDDKEGIRVVVKHEGQVLADFVVGKSAGAGTIIRPSGGDEIWRGTGILRFMFDKTPTDWRDKSITTFPQNDAARIDVKARDGSAIALRKTGTKQGNDDKWEITQSSLEVAKLDLTVPNGIASALSSWKTNDFADGVKPSDVGLDPPALTVTVGLKGDKSVTVLLGNKKGEDEIYAKKSDAPQIFLVKRYNLDRIDKRPLEFRDKTLCDVASDDLTEIAVSAGDHSYTLVKSGADWKVTKPAKLEVDSSKVAPIANAFKDWKANSFAEDQSLKANGLAKPKAVISVKVKGKGSAPACQIRVGDETKDKVSQYLASAKAADVYVGPKWAVDRILVKPDDLRKAGSAGAKK